jgi:hypothetical protein
MKQVTILLSLLINSSNAFAPKLTNLVPCTRSSLRVEATEAAEAPSDVEIEEKPSQLSIDSTTLRNELLYTAKSLTEDSPTGIFLTTADAITKFTTAASRLETITPFMTEREKELLIGDWELIATTRSLKSTNVKVPDGMKKLPFNIKTPKLNDSIRNSITVLQSIRSDDRIDHVIQYTPLTLSDFIPENSPLKAIRNWNVNPLDVSQSKITLIHDAEIESIQPTLRTKLGLKSVVVNVAGKSQYLETDGSDILGLNIPSLGDFANGGAFDSTYVDENVRVSRGTIGFLEEVRLFVRKGYDMDEIMEAGYEAMIANAEEEEKTEVEARLEKIGDAVANVVGAVESLDKDVRGVVEKDIESVTKAVDEVRDTIAVGVKDVQNVVEDDLKKVSKAVGDVRAAVVGQESAEEAEEDDVVVDVEAVDDTSEDDNEDDVPSDVN